MLIRGFSVYYCPLNFLVTQTQGVITAIRNKDENIIQKLLAMGVHKGVQITLEEKLPSFVIRVGESRISLNRDIASSIKVRVTTFND